MLVLSLSFLIGLEFFCANQKAYCQIGIEAGKRQSITFSRITTTNTASYFSAGPSLNDELFANLIIGYDSTYSLNMGLTTALLGTTFITQADYDYYKFYGQGHSTTSSTFNGFQLGVNSIIYKYRKRFSIKMGMESELIFGTSGNFRFSSIGYETKNGVPDTLRTISYREGGRVVNFRIRPSFTASFRAINNLHLNVMLGTVFGLMKQPELVVEYSKSSDNGSYVSRLSTRHSGFTAGVSATYVFRQRY